MKLYIETMGCPKNLNDSEGAAGIWEASGNEITEDPADADAIMVNTCGFINDAKQESIDTIFDMARFISESVGNGSGGERKLLIVSGCLSQRYGDELADEMPEADIFIGVNDYEKLPQLVGRHKAMMAESDGKAGQTRMFSDPYGSGNCRFEEFSARKTGENPYSATLRIAEGCDNCCAYCVIPQIRGGYRSRPMENIVEEAAKLASKGCRELILIAQDVTEYGRDLYGKLMLPELLRRLCRVDGIRWIRLMYCYEDKITDELIDVVASEEKICHYMDIPLQHISDNVLRAMNRRSTSESIRDTIGRLRKAIPDIHIRTTMIVGFPGETDEDMDELLDFVGETRFERLGVFAYSREEGTVAGDMEDQIDEEVKAARVDAVMRLQMEISREVNEAKKGRIVQVMVDGTDEEGAYLGRTCYDAPEIDNTVIFDADRTLVPGDMVQVRVIDAFDYDLVGELVDTTEEEENESAK